MDRVAGTCLHTYRAKGRWRNESLRVQSLLDAGERFIVAGDELSCDAVVDETAEQVGKVWVWDLFTGEVVAMFKVPWGGRVRLRMGLGRRRAVGRDGKEKGRKNIMSCLA
ncbi:uncharacterized protein PgNI_11977 [Pyricularia grisea]|uniref:Uncharacterized protein n=1 Tax=Pyricularia grisea TaxID=148305 RepID=A0A6P8AQL7_PYRGI|nr:uncharacterized protein PgNI_11977 [Pyricularia grisea]TLD04336.1 hypothetical protein PgNI_11977 [Pyricularia grisea]